MEKTVDDESFSKISFEIYAWIIVINETQKYCNFLIELEKVFASSDACKNTLTSTKNLKKEKKLDSSNEKLELKSVKTSRTYHANEVKKLIKYLIFIEHLLIKKKSITFFLECCVFLHKQSACL